MKMPLIDMTREQAAAQLRARAYRILNDGMAHSDDAWRWALETLGLPTPESIEIEAMKAPFTLRELSLGAQLW